MSIIENFEHVISLDVKEVEDRGKITAILAKNGYVVAHGKRRSGSGRSYVYTVDVYRRGDSNGN